MVGQWLADNRWNYHNTDYVYQKVLVNLTSGPVSMTLRKGTNGRYDAARLVDLLCLTSDLKMEPGDEIMGWKEATETEPAEPTILARCVRAVYVRLNVSPKGRVIFELEDAAGQLSARK